jgi:hypothetical protein
VKPILICLIAILTISSVLVYGCYRLVRFPGDRGKAYETWEPASNTFKVRITAYYEVGIYMPGAFVVCESARVGSNKWREFKVYRTDDAIPILRERFRFVNDQTAYYYTADDFLVTVNGGLTWSVWRPLLPQSNGERTYWAITEAYVEADGTGKAKLWNYDARLKEEMSLEVRTEDYGQSWNAIQGTAKHNKRLQRTGISVPLIDNLPLA